MNIMRYMMSEDLADYPVLEKDGPDYIGRTFGTVGVDWFDYHYDIKRNTEIQMLTNWFPEEDKGKRLMLRVKVRRVNTFTQAGPFAEYSGSLGTDEFAALLGWDGLGAPPGIFWDHTTGDVSAGIWHRIWDNPEHTSWHDEFVRAEYGTLSLSDLLVLRAALIASFTTIIRDDLVEFENVAPNFKSPATIETLSKGSADPIFVDRGEWDRETEYNVNDKVTYKTKTFYAISRSKGVKPAASDTVFWSINKPKGFRETDKRSQIYAGKTADYSIMLGKLGSGIYGVHTPHVFDPPEIHNWNRRENTSYPSPSPFGFRWDTNDINIPQLGEGIASNHWSAAGGFFTPSITNGNFTAAYQITVTGYNLLTDLPFVAV